MRFQKGKQGAHNGRSKRTVALLSLCLLAALSFGCGDDSPQPKAAVNSSSGSAFSVPQDQMPHIQIVTVEPGSLTRTLRLTGTVAFNGFDTTPVITQVGGPVTRILAVPGQFVHAGQPLLYVASPDYSLARATYLKANDTYQLADKEYSRAEDLYNHHALSQHDLLAAESARTQAMADLQSSEQSLRVLGINPQAASKASGSPEIPVLAPIAGEVVERLVAPGQVIQSGSTQAFTISNTSTVWVLASIYQQDLPYVHVGDPVAITADAYPGTDFNGKISYIAPALDATTRTLQARIVVKNPHEMLKKDMYVTAQVQAAKIAHAITVPDAAVLRDAENQPFVYVVTGPDQFGRRGVAIGDENQGRTEVTSGLSAGDRVVADGSLFLQFANSIQQ
jgi:membrane fusion protein, heavy metal efflux system